MEDETQANERDRKIAVKIACKAEPRSRRLHHAGAEVAARAALNKSFAPSVRQPKPQASVINLAEVRGRKN